MDMERDMDVGERSEKRRLRTSSTSFKTVSREIVMKYLEEDEQRNLEEYNTTTEEEIDSCESFLETDTDVEERSEKRRLRTSSSFQNVTKEIVMKYLEEEEEQRKLEAHNMTTDEEMDSCESFSDTETDTDVEERSKKRRLRTSSSFQIVTKEIVMKYLEEEEEQRKREAHKMITEEMDSCETETLSSRREDELLLEIGRLTDRLKMVKKRLKERKKREREIENERKMQTQAERERVWEQQKKIEREFLEKQRKRTMELVEREQEWKKTREMMKEEEREHQKRRKQMEKRLKKMEKEIQQLKKKEEKQKEPEREKKSFRKTVRGWMDRFINAVRSLKAT